MSRFRGWAVAFAVVLIAAFTIASTMFTTSDPVDSVSLPQNSTGVIADPAPADGVSVSRALFERSDEAIVVAPSVGAADWTPIRQVADAHQVPVFAVTDSSRAAVAGELRRLGTKKVVVAGDPTQVGAVTAAPMSTDLHELSGRRVATRDATLAYLAADAGPDAEATAQAAGARVVRVPVADPRSTGESVRALREHPDAGVRAFGAGFGDSREFSDRVHAARTEAELPGGGQVVFPGRRLVALYGSPGAPSLGPLGAQDLGASIRRVRTMAAQYQPYSAAPVVPAFEIIATVASSEPGPDNSYSSMIDPAQLRPWVRAARAAGIYVTLDLQPGRTDFLTQAKRYADLLAEPNVGLALDAEWRLKPNQVHLTQIGSVSADEVNRTSDWLAGLVRARGLPQKLLVLHEFDSGMLEDRGRIVTSRPELQTVIHADGHGDPPTKMGTWRRLITDLPPNVWLGWKNFYTEDHPTFPPARTMQVRPTPWFVSYQ